MNAQTNIQTGICRPVTGVVSSISLSVEIIAKQRVVFGERNSWWRAPRLCRSTRLFTRCGNWLHFVIITVSWLRRINHNCNQQQNVEDQTELQWHKFSCFLYPWTKPVTVWVVSRVMCVCVHVRACVRVSACTCICMPCSFLCSLTMALLWLVRVCVVIDVFQQYYGTLLGKLPQPKLVGFVLTS